MKKLTLLAGLGAGYVLGAKAGQQRYNEIKRKFDEVMGRPEVQRATEKLTATASELASTAKDKATETAAKVQHKHQDQDQTLDLTQPAPASTQTPGTTSMPGAPTTTKTPVSTVPPPTTGASDRSNL